MCRPRRPFGANLALTAAGSPGQDARPGFCHISSAVDPAATQVKFSVVYPLPWKPPEQRGLSELPGFPIAASYVATDAEIRPSLGRHLAACPSQTAATCNQTVIIDLIPANTIYDDRIQQLDVRFSRTFPMGRSRVQGNIDVYNMFNASTILNEQTRYRSRITRGGTPYRSWAGACIKFSAQLSF